MMAVRPDRGPEWEPVASWRHTVILVLVFIAVAAAGAISSNSGESGSSSGGSHPDVLPLYASLVLMEWGLVAYVWRGLRRTGTPLRAIIGGRWQGVRDVAVDVALAASLWGGWMLIEQALKRMMDGSPGSRVDRFLAHGGAESALWVVLSMSAGFAEELVFRGYFQRQFAALTGRRSIAVVLQAVLFGISHGYQGAAACGHIALYGLLFGALAAWRRSLRPGMIAHALTDIIAGLT